MRSEIKYAISAVLSMMCVCAIVQSAQAQDSRYYDAQRIAQERAMEIEKQRREAAERYRDDVQEQQRRQVARERDWMVSEEDRRTAERVESMTREKYQVWREER